MIDWRPMNELPNEAKDGRFVLLWHARSASPDLGMWDQGKRSSRTWWVPTFQTGGEEIAAEEYSHFAMIDPPK